MNESAGPSKTPLGKLRRYLAGSGRAIGWMLVALGAIFIYQKLSDPYGLFDPPGDTFLLTVGLIGGGILLLRDDPTVKTSVPAEDVSASRHKVARVRSPLTLFTLAAAFVTIGVGIILGNLSVLTLSIGQLTALAVMVVGAGLIVGAWWGRARWLIPVGILLAPAVMVTSYIDMPPRGSVGSVHLRPTSESELKSRYNLLFGNLNLDLTRIKRVSGTSFVNLNVAAGNVTVYVPERVTLRVAGHIEWGNTTVGRGYESGEDLSFSQVFEGKPGAGTLDVDVNGGITSLYVERISRRDRFGPRRDGRARRDGAAREGRDRTRKEGARAGSRNDGKPGGRHGRRSGRG